MQEKLGHVWRTFIFHECSCSTPFYLYLVLKRKREIERKAEATSALAMQDVGGGTGGVHHQDGRQHLAPFSDTGVLSWLCVSGVVRRGCKALCFALSLCVYIYMHACMQSQNGRYGRGLQDVGVLYAS